MLRNKQSNHLVQQKNVRYGSSDYLIDFFFNIYSNIVNFTKNRIPFEYGKWYHITMVRENKKYYNKTTNFINYVGGS